MTPTVVDAGQAGAARDQLERILASGAFGNADSLIRLLRFVVDETIAGRAGRLKEYTLGVEVFQRGEDFDPRIDTIVRTQARRLRARLQDYYAGPGSADPIVIDLPKGTYVPVFRHRVTPKGASAARAGVIQMTAALVAVAVLIVVTLSIGVRPPAAIFARAGQRAEPDAEAYRLYLKSRLGPKTPASIALLEQALRIDPSFGAAWLAKAEHHLIEIRRANAAPATALPAAREAARRAIALGHDTASAHAVLAAAAVMYDWNWDVAEKEFRRAIELDPHGGWWRLNYAQLLAFRGRTDEALEQVKQIDSVDRTSAALPSARAAIYYLSRQFDRTIEYCRTVLEVSPDTPDCHYWTGRAYLSKGMLPEAIGALERRHSNPGQGFGMPVTAYLTVGRRADAIRIRTEAERRATTAYVSPVSLAQVYFAFGEAEAGFGQLERALEMRDQSLLNLKIEPAYDGIRSDPRFQRVLRRMGL